jgi:arylsulfatase A-like enzyme
MSSVTSDVASEAVSARPGAELHTDEPRRARTYFLGAVFGGVLVYAVEVIDRTVTLWQSFNSPIEPFRYALYLAPGALLATLVGLVAALFFAAAHAGLAGGDFVASRAPANRARLIRVATAALGLGILTFLFFQLRPSLFVRPLQGFVRKLDTQFVPLSPVLDHFSFLLIAILVAAWLVVIAVHEAFGIRRESPARKVLFALLPLAALASIAGYWADATIHVGRYNIVFHIPATLGLCALAFVTGSLAVALFASNASRRQAWSRVAAVLVFALVAATAAAFTLLGSNENVRALLWRRSVVARHAYWIASRPLDRDKDGFPRARFGADVDDRDPSVNPWAAEIPGNGIDDNCFGGDAAPGTVEPSATASAAPAAPVAKNFLLIAIDTLRADRMGVYGYGRPTTPRIGEYAKSARFFAHSYSAGTNTGVSFSAMQRSATRGGVFDESRQTLFEAMSGAGFVTAQVNAASDEKWLALESWKPYKDVIMRGIGTATHATGEERWDGDRVTDEAIAYLSSIPPGTRHATWVHYLDTHLPREWRSEYDYGHSESDIYDGEVAFVDRQVGRLLDFLKSSGRLDDTIVVLMSDHGEGFGEHEMDQHQNRPHSDQIVVPMIVWAPGAAPARVEAPVTTIDIAPTVLGALGLPGLANAEGVDMLAADLAPRPIFAETPINVPQPSFFDYAVTDGSWRLIYDVWGDTTELYDLAADPAELRNLADAEPTKVNEMKRTMARWLDGTQPVRPTSRFLAPGEAEKPQRRRQRQ